MDFTLTTIIVTWNSSTDINTCLNSLISSTVNLSHQIIVVDNHSSDNTVKIIKTKFPQVKLIKSDKNLGFARGNNLAYKGSRSQYVLLLNPDTKINTQAINRMVSFLNTHPDTAAVGPEQVKEKFQLTLNMSKINFTGITEYLVEKLFFLFTGKHTILFAYPHRVPILNAGCLMLRQKAIGSKEIFDSNLFLYGEEPDLFLRLKKAGWKSYLLRNCYMYHYRDKSVMQTNKKFHYVTNSFLYLFLKKTRK